MQARLREEKGVAAGIGTLWRFFRGQDYTVKKTAHAAEQDREDVLARRESWFEGQLDLDPAKLVPGRAGARPHSEPGDVVILDNLPAHKGPAIRHAVESTCARLLFLPPYTPDPLLSRTPSPSINPSSPTPPDHTQRVRQLLRRRRL